MINQKLRELNEILIEAKWFIVSDDFGVLKTTWRFDIELLKKTTQSMHIIVFDNLKELVDTFKLRFNEEIVRNIEAKVISMSMINKIGIDNKIVLKILLS